MNLSTPFHKYGHVFQAHLECCSLLRQNSLPGYGWPSYPTVYSAELERQQAAAVQSAAPPIVNALLFQLFFLLRFEFQQFLGVEHRLEFPVTRHLALVAKVWRLGILALTRRQDTDTPDDGF